MKALIISDNEFVTEEYENLNSKLKGYLATKDFEIEEVRVDRDMLASCMGCFGCWMKTPGECVIRDGIGQINRSSMQSDAVFYLSPVVFGQFSANMTDVINRWLPNMLPFFMKRPDGSTMHPSRYESYPANVMIGYGDAVTDEDAQLFADINQKHRSNVVAFVYRRDIDIAEQLDGVRLTRTGGML